MPAVPELDLTRIRQFCDHRVPSHLRNEARVEADVRGKSVTIFDCRPPWHPNLTDWSRLPIAQLRYDPTSHLWTLYWADRNSRWHRYDDLDPGTVDDLLDEINDDPTCIFWGDLRSQRRRSLLHHNAHRTDRHHHRPMPVTSETALAVKALARQYQEAIWARQHTVNRLRSVLLEYYLNALDAFPNLTHRAALTILAAAPSPARAATLTIKKTVALLRRCGRGDRPGLAEQIVHDLTAATLRQPPPVEQALATAATGLVSVITAMEKVIADLEAAMAAEFNGHPHADLLHSVPGLARSWPHGYWPRSAMPQTGSPPRAGYALSPAPPRSPGPRGEPRSSTRDASATAASPTPATGGPSPRSPSHPVPELTTAVGGQPATDTTPRCATSPTNSSAGSGGASSTTGHGAIVAR